MDPGLAFGQVLRHLRKAADLSQGELAIAAGVERNFVSLIERGINQPSIRIVFRLADALNVPASKMIYFVEEILAEKVDSKNSPDSRSIKR